MSSQPFVHEAQEAQEASDSPKLPRRKNKAKASRHSLLDAVVNQMLKEQPNQADSSYNSENREQRDLSLVQEVHLACTSGDTLIVVNFPPGHVNCRWHEWTPKRFCAQSEKLLGTQSKVFTNLLSPERQGRLRRRLEIQHPGESFPQKFVIDLTPSTEGDELAAQLMELSLPSGVRDWWMSKERLGISPYLVSGHDDHCPRHNEVPINCQKTEDYGKHDSGRDEFFPKIDLADIQMPRSRVIEDYCPIRHRANIIRLILAIEGYDLVLNSAPRVYTLAGIANILDCTSVIRDSVCTWLMAEPNNEFIDINPEAALKIAWTMKLPNITRAAFRILVVEKTLETLAPEPQAKGSRRTVFGRPREDLPDDLQNPIEYAALKLADRVQQTLAVLKSDQFYENPQFLEYQKLLQTGDLIGATLAGLPLPSAKKLVSEAETTRFVRLNELSSLFESLKEKLSEYKDWLVRESLNAAPSIDRQKDADRDRRCYVSRVDWNPTATIYSEFSDAQRLLTPYFWEGMILYSFAVSKPGSVNEQLEVLVNKFNRAIDAMMMQYLYPHEGNKMNPHSLHFNLPELRRQLNNVLGDLSWNWTKPALETPLTRTRHLALALSDDEFKYLPLWADGLDDGTGGVFESAVPDADLGPIGPGPAYRTGNTVATDTSSICQSEMTPSQASTITMTAGQSIVAVPSNTGFSTPHDGASIARSQNYAISTTSSVVMVDAPDIMDESNEDDAFDFNDSDEISDEAWSQVEEP
ncbi:hypothetical protein M434DRAFT_10737 [Hypoxylon sp. CO27-5]|nr:hypothetical protein M434DRAFT_10737 [Hypoxylon sp. CO27-5]